MFGGAQRQDEGQRAQIGAQGVVCEREEELCAVRVAEPWHSCPERWGSLLLCRDPNLPGCCVCSCCRELLGEGGVAVGELHRSLPAPTALGLFDPVTMAQRQHWPLHGNSDSQEEMR